MIWVFAIIFGLAIFVISTTDRYFNAVDCKNAGYEKLEYEQCLIRLKEGGADNE